MFSVAQPEAREGPGRRAPDAVLREALQGILRLAPKKLKELRDESTADLARLDGAALEGTVGGADAFFKSLSLGCEAAGSPKVVATALEATQELLASGALAGMGSDPFKEGGGRRLIDSVIESVCNCADQGDESVQMHMIRSLESAVTSQHCEVHNESLMLAVSTCFKLNRDSKISSSQRSAHNSLTQMLNVVVQRMELSSGDMSRTTPAPFDETVVSSQRSAQEAKMAASELALLPPRQVLHDLMSTYVTMLVDKVVLDTAEKTGSQSAIAEDCPELGPPGKFGWCVVCRRSAGHYCVNTQDPVCGKACKHYNLERLRLVQQHFGSHREDLEIAERLAEAEAASEEGACLQALAREGAASDTDASFASASCLRQGAATAAAEPASAKALASLNPHHKDAVQVFEYAAACAEHEGSTSGAD
ncbi:unnamed protein product [Prorocentrum cordatum]|uniref:Mon2/Sec7/BIG1-like dimerisation and cyclophilin-binding domain-containing protein n=1 Tax=Prorocentrum cordatum TaxID=2364126 RepID=A0ABN9YCY3_9DINO|nr:unnamed protein product [Polarella glacialis]